MEHQQLKKLSYNTQKSILIIPEYGRNIQIMIDYIKNEIKERDVRTQAANTVIDLMAQANPQLKTQAEYMQKLWGHFYHMADYEIDIDSPFPAPQRPIPEKIKRSPISYPKRQHKYHFYGENIEMIIKKSLEIEDEELKDKLVKSIAVFMKISYKTWNDDKVSDHLILEHLKELSEGKIILNSIPDIPRYMEKSMTKEIPKKKKIKKKSSLR